MLSLSASSSRNEEFMIRKRSAKQAGVQIAELAICLPVLAFLLCMIVDGADFVRTHVVLNNAAREGARIASMCTSSGGCPNIQAAVQTYVAGESASRLPGCSASQLAPGNISVNQSVPWAYTNSSGVTINATASQVTITYPYTFCYLPNVSTLFGSGMSNTYTLQTSATFRNF
jgi:Flp pilus assembly protein TadG